MDELKKFCLSVWIGFKLLCLMIGAFIVLLIGASIAVTILLGMSWIILKVLGVLGSAIVLGIVFLVMMCYELGKHRE